MVRTRSLSTAWLIAISLALVSSRGLASIIVYDSAWDYSTVNNPSGVWSYLDGTTPLTFHSPVPGPLSAAVSPGYWGQGPSNLNSSIMLSTANGSATSLWNDSDFIIDTILMRTADPGLGGPTVLRFTAPSAGWVLYGASNVWYADAPSGPMSNDFQLTLNNTLILESGTVTLGNDIANPIPFVNGFTPIPVLAGDHLELKAQRAATSPFGSLMGVAFVIDFTAIPEPNALLLLTGAGSIVASSRRRAGG